LTFDYEAYQGVWEISIVLRKRYC